MYNNDFNPCNVSLVIIVHNTIIRQRQQQDSEREGMKASGGLKGGI